MTARSGPLRAAESAALKAHLEAVTTWCELTSGPEIEASTRCDRIGTQTSALEAQARMKISGRVWWRTKKAREAAERG